MLGPGLPEVLHQLIGRDEVGTVVPLVGLPGQSHRQVGLTHAGRSQHQDIGRLGDKGQVGQFLDLPLVDGGLEGEVELFQGALEGGVSHLCPGANVAFSAGIHLCAQKLLQHLRVGELLAGVSIESVVQDPHGLLESQGLQVLAGLLQGDHGAPPTAASS